MFKTVIMLRQKFYHFNEILSLLISHAGSYRTKLMFVWVFKKKKKKNDISKTITFAKLFNFYCEINLSRDGEFFPFNRYCFSFSSLIYKLYVLLCESTEITIGSFVVTNETIWIEFFFYSFFELVLRYAGYTALVQC